MRYKRFLPLYAVSVLLIAAVSASAANTIGPIGGSLKPFVQTDPCISSVAIVYVSGRVSSGIGGDANAGSFLDFYTLSINGSTWGNLLQREDDFVNPRPGVAVTRDTLLSTDGSVIAYGTSVFTDITTFEGGEGLFTAVTINGNALPSLKATYVWSYDFWNTDHIGQLRICVFMKN